MADLDLGPAEGREKDWLDRLEADKEYLEEQFKPQPDGPDDAGPPGFEPKPLPGKDKCRKYYRDIDLGDIEAKITLPGIGEVASIDLGDDLGLDDTRKVNPLDVPGFKLPKKTMDRVNEAAQVTEVGEHLGGHWQWECIDFSKPEYYDQIGDDWFVTTGVELVRDSIKLSSEDWRDGVPENTLVRTRDGCVIPVGLLKESANLDGAMLWMEFADLAKFGQDLEQRIEKAETWKEDLLEEKREYGSEDWLAKDLREASAELRGLKRQLEHFQKWTGEPDTPTDRPAPMHRRPRLRVPSEKDMRDLSCEMMTLECLVRHFGGLGWTVDRPPTEEQARKYWEALARLRENFDEKAAERLLKCVKKKWPDWLQPPTAEELEELEEERRSKQRVRQETFPPEDRSLPVPDPEYMPTVPGMDMAQTVKYSRRATEKPRTIPFPSISWPATVIIGIIIGIVIGAGSIVWWPIQMPPQDDSQEITSPGVTPVCNYDGRCQPESGERSSNCVDCLARATATPRQPTPTTEAAVPPLPTATPRPSEAVPPTPTPPPTATPTLAPTPTDTAQPTPEPQCSPGEWSECGGRPPEVVCDDQHVSLCQPDGTWGPCQWDPGRCAPSEPEPPPGEECVCGNGVCETDSPCYESEFNCSEDCGPIPCEPWLDSGDCDAAGGVYVCDPDCTCLCPR
jgi:hypothetical protein